MVPDDYQLEGELPTQDQAPLDTKNLGDPPPRPDMNAEENTGATSEGTGRGAQALDQMAPKTIEDIANICIPPSGDPSLLDVSYVEEEDPSPPHSLSSRIDSVKYLPPAGDAGGDSSTQEFSAMGMEWEEIKEGEEILSRPKSLSSKEDEVRLFDPSLQGDSIGEEGEISLPLSLSSIDDKVTYRPPANNAGRDSGYYEFYAMGMEWEEIKYDEGEQIFSRPKSLSSNQNAPDELSQVTKRSISNASKIDSYDVKKENSEIKKENSALKREIDQLKIEMSKLKQARREYLIDHEALRNDTTSFQKEVTSPKAALNASVFQDDDMAQLATQEE